VQFPAVEHGQQQRVEVAAQGVRLHGSAVYTSTGYM
jgi:hypothetical protein